MADPVAHPGGLLLGHRCSHLPNLSQVLGNLLGRLNRCEVHTIGREWSATSEHLEQYDASRLDVSCRAIHLPGVAGSFLELVKKRYYHLRSRIVWCQPASNCILVTYTQQYNILALC